MVSKKQFVNLYELENINYREIIEILFKEASFFEIVDQYDELSEFLKPLESSFVQIRWSKKWAGTRTSKKAKIMSFSCDKSSRDFFFKFPCFIRSINDAKCSFGTSFQFDIVFYNELDFDKEFIFYLCAHEGLVNIKKNLIKIWRECKKTVPKLIETVFTLYTVLITAW